MHLMLPDTNSKNFWEEIPFSYNGNSAACLLSLKKKIKKNWRTVNAIKQVLKTPIHTPIRFIESYYEGTHRDHRVQLLLKGYYLKVQEQQAIKFVSLFKWTF